MRFVPDDGDVSPTAEWLARVSPFLRADDPHQRCIARAHAQGARSVDVVCDCPHGPCTKECCR